MVDAALAPHWVVAVKVPCHDNCGWLVCGFCRLSDAGFHLPQQRLDWGLFVISAVVHVRDIHGEYECLLLRRPQLDCCDIGVVALYLPM